MSEQPYPPLRPQRGSPVGRGAPPWPMIIGVVLLAVLASVMVALVLGGGTSPTTISSPSASAIASATPGPSGSASAPAVSASATASAAPAAIAPDGIVATAVDRLSVRSSAGTGAERLGSLSLGAQSFVVEGPTDADGYRWYLVSGLGLPPAADCPPDLQQDPYNCPFWFGWVAAADQNGDAWLLPTEIECPAADTPSATDLIANRTSLQRLSCYGSHPIIFRAWWPEIPDDAGLGGACAGQEEPSGWLLCQNINYTAVTIDEAEGFGGVGVRLSIDPASGLSMPDRGTWVEVRAHLDDPAAQGCDEAAAVGEDDRPPQQIVLECRAELVLEAVSAVDGP